MKRLLFTLATALCMAGWPSEALAITISLTPSSQTIGVSGIAYLNLVISGLGSMASPSLGGFFIDLEMAWVHPRHSRIPARPARSTWMKFPLRTSPR